ncbi:Inner membrane amino-acid ABC transporter permease protein yecS [Achromobacter spanius]|jgi:polar amino acid transport system permease protein|uniref:Amino acid ABC transporter permease n=1 Tax=Achromobacter spanius TaxID=217203 RepID=A0AA42IYG2_9BURK|nr:MULTISPECIES: amino acid ABC transporter permease [Achromobacter]SPT38436.1 Inner membrane amino-acid ABC transporter permease protein yecS [Achromobacter denitrificans]AUA55565.1 polar amino acid ABC transporter permease [Achromobacter spanius]MCS3508182.1 polar amino acid transport system permease protein [Achromobacter sp. JUb104]MDH0734441.1 amino acid ABC transporter permease [Achromobacter spanius]CAB3669845.1 L-cystine transport system permease protein YecS [Achromobacter spanius]
MAYQYDFASVFDYTPVLIKGIGVTIELIAFGAVAGVALGIACAWVRTQGPRALRAPVTAYVEVIRNTPFLIQLFFVFFGLPSLGIQLGEMQAACLAMALNLGAYSTEIIRAGIDATPKGQYEAGASLAMTRFQVFRHVVLKPALQRIWPALSSQIVIVMLGSAVCSQIAAEDLTFAANFIQSRNFRAFEVYLVTTGIYLALAIVLRQLLRMTGRRLFRKAAR